MRSGFCVFLAVSQFFDVIAAAFATQLVFVTNCCDEKFEQLECDAPRIGILICKPAIGNCSEREKRRGVTHLEEWL